MPIAGPIAGAVAGAAVSAALTDDDPGGAKQASADASRASAGATAQEMAQSKELFDFYQANFQPLEKDLAAAGGDWLAKAKTYGSPEEVERAAGVAHGDVTQAFSRARDATTRTMASYGVNPASGQFGNMTLRSNLDEAKADVLAQETARQTARDTGFNKAVAATGVAQNISSVGRGLPATAITGTAAAANTSAATANSQFLQGQVLANQERQGMAPLVSAVAKGVTKWWDTPTQPEQIYPG